MFVLLTDKRSSNVTKVSQGFRDYMVQILDYINYLKPKRTLFTHMTALLDQEDLLSRCPENVQPAYDGLEINL